MSLAVFILPKEPFNTELIHWKERVKNELPGQPYSVHPPHMTLMNIDVTNEKDGIAAASAFAGTIDPIRMAVNSRDVFWNDNATGGHTLFFGIEQNLALFDLQKSLAEALLSVKKKLPAPNYTNLNMSLFESFKKYGFPFVGDHWIPHFSVASLLTEQTNSIISDFLSIKKPYDFMVNQISLWRVNGDEHIQLETVNFQ
jgi:hypothetical protein